MRAAMRPWSTGNMPATGSNRIALLAMLAPAALFALNLALAAPPGVTLQNGLPRTNVAQKPILTNIAARLDLRAPTRASMSEDKSQVFPSAVIHRPFGGGEETARLPSMGAANPHLRPPMVELARHIQHEGLPVARLWENQSALVHIGLNQRGKPGLWLVQKIH
jgi:hypothetical protein